MFGYDLSLVNLVGLVVCLLGISLHVVRKASSAPNITAKQASPSMCAQGFQRSQHPRQAEQSLPYIR
jgi:hypothetical protein